MAASSFTADYLLRVCQPYLDPHLVAPAARPLIQAIARQLPSVSGLVLECRLEANAPAVDFIPRFNRFDGSDQFFINRSLYPDAADPHPIWSRIHHFYRHWCDPQNTLLNQNVLDTWLEFDLDGGGSALPLPSFYTGKVGLHGIGPAMYTTERMPRAADHLPVAEAILGLLFGGPVPAAVWSSVGKLYEALPPGAIPFAIGMMLPRTQTAARFVIIGLPADQIGAFLSRAGWPGDLDALQRVTAALSPFTDRIAVSLDVGHTLSRQVGLECFLSEYNPQKEPRWSQFVHYLVEGGLCTPEKGRAILAWYGHFTLTPSLPHSLTPLPIFRREISHLKVVYRPDGSLAAKGYLEMRVTRKAPATKVATLKAYTD
ncbi:MAG: hypothetical protein AB1791_02185 [Chloroflexota bacterium]